MAGKETGDAGACDDPRLQDIVLVDGLPSDFWFEGIAVRPSGSLLLTNIKDPELLAIDSSTEGSPEDRFHIIPPRIAHAFPDANGAFNICALPGAKGEEYAVATGYADPANGHFYGFVVWRVVMPPDESDGAPEVSKIADLPDARFVTGIVPISENTLAIADSNGGCIWRLDIPSGQPSMLFKDPVLAPPTSGEDGYFGVSRVRFTENYGWATNTAFGVLYRFPIEYTDGGKDLEVTGPVEALASGLTNADGMVVLPDESAVYVGSYMTGDLWRVDLEDDGATAKGTVSVVRAGLVSPTAMELVYHAKGGKPTLYVTCCNPLSQENTDDNKWLDLTNIDRSKLEITITVTTEVTYEYI
ncbi:hypothetical protein ACO1O0_002822 [Amphichorda felina]